MTVTFTEPPETEWDPPPGDTAAAEADTLTDNDPGIDAEVDIPEVPTAWSNLQPAPWGQRRNSVQRSQTRPRKLTRCVTATGADVVVKAYRPGTRNLTSIWARWRDLTNSGAPLVPLLDTIVENGIAYEMLPWYQNGSLDQLLHNRPLTTDQLTTLIQTLDQAVSALHQPPDHTAWMHRDIKPSNLLVESGEPLRVLLGDPETALPVPATDQGQRADPTTVHYAAPEALQGFAMAESDHWSIGVTIAEAGLGHHPMQRDGLLPTGNVIRQTPRMRLTLTRLDDRLQHLVRGLTIEDAHLRWGHGEIVGWLAGDSLPLLESHQTPQPEHHQSPEPTAPTVPTFLFNGTRYTTVAELAAQMEHDWDAAMQVVMGRDAHALVEWLNQAYPDQARQVAESIGRFEAGQVEAAYALCEVLWYLNPDGPPTFQGHLVRDAGDLQRITEAALRPAGQAAPMDEEVFLERLRISGALAVLGRRTGHHQLAVISDQWDRMTTVTGLLSVHLDQHVSEAQATQARSAIPILTLHGLLSPTGRDRLHRAAQDELDTHTDHEWLQSLRQGPASSQVPRDAVVVAVGPHINGSVTVRPEIDEWIRSQLAEALVNGPAAPEAPPNRNSHWIGPAAVAAAVVLINLVGRVSDTAAAFMAVATLSWLLIASWAARRPRRPYRWAPVWAGAIAAAVGCGISFAAPGWQPVAWLVWFVILAPILVTTTWPQHPGRPTRPSRPSLNGRLPIRARSSTRPPPSARPRSGRRAPLPARPASRRSRRP